MIVLKSLLAVQHVMINDKHCFELYGYDIIIDAELKPWLLEVNASPSLIANTREDYLMKTEMLHGMLDIVDMEGKYRVFPPLVVDGFLTFSHVPFLSICSFFLSILGLLQGTEEHVSGWDLVYDNGYIEIDPDLCGYSTFLGAGVPEGEDTDGTGSGGAGAGGGSGANKSNAGANDGEGLSPSTMKGTR